MNRLRSRDLRAAALVAGFCLGTSGFVRAEKVTVVYTATVGALGNSGGEDLANGSLVRFGFFDTSPEDVESNSLNLEYLLAHFYGISETAIGLFDGEPPMFDGVPFHFDGVFAHTVSFDPQTTVFPGFGEGLVGARPYIWSFNAASVDEATEHGLFSAEGWSIPAIQGDFFEVDAVRPSMPGDVYVGTFNPGGSQVLSEDGGNLHQLVAFSEVVIPEPEAVLYLAFSLALGLMRRSRKVGA